MRVLVGLLVALVAQTMALPFEGRIVGGYPASDGQFPHQVSMQINGRHFCGGSLIAPDTILTAAHCVFGNNSPMIIVAGTTKLQENGQRRSVVFRDFHPSYDPKVISNDVGIVRVETPFQIDGQSVNIINLRTNAANPGEILTLSGWGLTAAPPGGDIPNDLQCINLRALDLNTCAQELQGIGEINTGHVCTTSPVNQGACQGDSGGPLIDAQGQQIGVVSWGYPCAKGYPDVFTSVPFFLAWIKDH